MRNRRLLGTGLAALALGLGPVAASAAVTRQAGGALPAGLALSSSGILSGTADSEGAGNLRYAEWAWHRPAGGGPVDKDG